MPNRTDRQVVVPVWGGGLLVMPEPDWCTGHPLDLADHPGDFEHSGPDIEFSITTPSGPVVVLRAALGLRPFDQSGACGPVSPHVAVEVDGAWHRFAPDGLATFANHLAETWAAIADRLHQLGAELAALRDESTGGGR